MAINHSADYAFILYTNLPVAPDELSAAHIHEQCLRMELLTLMKRLIYAMLLPTIALLGDIEPTIP